MSKWAIAYETEQEILQMLSHLYEIYICLWLFLMSSWLFRESGVALYSSILHCVLRFGERCVWNCGDREVSDGSLSGWVGLSPIP